MCLCPSCLFACLLAFQHACLQTTFPSACSLLAHQPKQKGVQQYSYEFLVLWKSQSASIFWGHLISPVASLPSWADSAASGHTRNYNSIKITFPVCAPKPVLQLGSALSITTDMGILQKLCLIPKLCYSSGASSSDRWVASTSRLKPASATHS